MSGMRTFLRFGGSVAAVLAFGLVVSATFYRTSRCYHVPVPKETVDFGLCDFHNAVYFPGLAYANRENPYLGYYAEKYPVNREMSPYSPLLLPFAALFGVLPLRPSEILWCVFNTLLILWLADWVRFAAGWRRSVTTVFGIGAVLAATRAGHSNLILGQFAALMSIATFYALYDAEHKPMRSAIALTVASIKPTFGLPLFFLLACRRKFRVVVLAGILSVCGAVGSFAWIQQTESGLQQSLTTSHDAIVVDADVDPTSAWMRTDFMSVLYRFASVTPSAAMEFGAMLILLAPVGMILWRRSGAAPKQADDAASWPDLDDILTMSLIPLVIYHLAYDCLVVTPAIAALLAARGRLARVSLLTRWSLASLLVISTMNYLTTWSIMERLGVEGAARDLIITITPISLMLASIGLWWVAVGFGCRSPQVWGASRQARQGTR